MWGSSAELAQEIDASTTSELPVLLSLQLRVNQIRIRQSSQIASLACLRQNQWFSQESRETRRESAVQETQGPVGSWVLSRAQDSSFGLLRLGPSRRLGLASAVVQDLREDDEVAQGREAVSQNDLSVASFLHRSEDAGDWAQGQQSDSHGRQLASRPSAVISPRLQHLQKQKKIVFQPRKPNLVD